MNKKILKEDTNLVLFFANILYPLAVWVGLKVYNSYRYSENFYTDGAKILKKYLTDKDFVKDLIDVIKEEGGINDFIQKTKKLVPDKDVDDYLYTYFKGGIKNPEMQRLVTGKTAPAIVDKVLAKPTFQRYVKTYKMKPAWIKDAGEGIYDVISSSDFRDKFRKMLKQAGQDASLADNKIVSKNINSETKISLKKLLPKV